MILLAAYDKIEERIVASNRKRMILAKLFSVVVIWLLIPSLLLDR